MSDLKCNYCGAIFASTESHICRDEWKAELEETQAALALSGVAYQDMKKERDRMAGRLRVCLSEYPALIEKGEVRSSFGYLFDSLDEIHEENLRIAGEEVSDENIR